MSPRLYWCRGIAKIRQIGGSAIPLFRFKKDQPRKQNTHTGPANEKKRTNAFQALVRPLISE